MHIIELKSSSRLVKYDNNLKHRLIRYECIYNSTVWFLSIILTQFKKTIIDISRTNEQMRCPERTLQST